MSTVDVKRHDVVPGNCQHVGARSEQQDSFGFSDFDDGHFVAHGGVLAIVADGMGGLAMGRESSASAVQTFLAGYSEKESDEKIAAALDRCMHAANRAVTRKAAEAGVEGEAGTTLVAVVVHENLLYRIGSGDSRIYLFRNGELKQLTTDYNYGRILDKMVEKGEISRAEAASHPSRAALTSYLGKAEIDDYDRPSDPPVELQPGDKVLLASDGLFGFLPEEEIVHLLGQSPQRASEALVAATIGHKFPYQDNVTVAILAYKPAPDITLADTQHRKTGTSTKIGVKTVGKGSTGKWAKMAVLILVLAIAGFFGGKFYYANSAVTNGFDGPPEKMEQVKPEPNKPGEKTLDKIPEKKTETSPAQTPVKTNGK